MSVTKLVLDRQAEGRVFPFGTTAAGGDALVTLNKGTAALSTVLLDVKASANIGGDLIPLGSILNQSDKISRDNDVIIYCRSGSRSGAAIQALEKQFGYSNLYNLKGGILAYAKEIDNSLPVF